MGIRILRTWIKNREMKQQNIKREERTSVRRLIICAVIFALIYSVTNSVGKLLAGYGEYGVKRTCLLFIIAFPLAFMVSVILLYGYDVGIRFCSERAFGRYCAAFTEKKFFFPLIWIFIFLAWLPGFLASYPGVYVIDNVFQIEWFLKGTISAHHPILHTYLLGTFVNLGKLLLGSFEAGMAMYSILQMIVLSGIFAYTIKSLKGKIPAVMQIIVAAFYAFLPFHAISSFTATKDVLYSGLFLLLILKTYEIVMDQDKFFNSLRRMAMYLVLVFLSCCFRNTGIYIFICTIPVFLIICRRYRTKILVLGAVSLVLWISFIGPFYHVIGITKGSSAEVMSVPMQQLSRAVLKEGDRISPENLSAIQEFIPNYELYAARVADPVKDTFNGKLLEEDTGRFLKLWIQTGLSCPRSYVEAFLELNLGFWYPKMYYPDPATYLAFIPYRNADVEQVGNVLKDAVYLERTSYIPKLTSFYENYVEDGGFQKNRFISMLFSPGFYFLVLCFGILLCIYKRKYQMTVPMGMMFILWLTLMVSPVVVFRYAYPLVVCLPVMLAMVSDMDGKQNIRK